MSTINEKMTALANQVRILSGTSTTKSIATMTTDIDEANTTIDEQSRIIRTIQDTLASKATAGSGTYKGEYNDAVSYTVGDVVLYQGDVYQCTVNTVANNGYNPVDFGSYWNNGQPINSIKWAQPWREGGISYLEGEIVIYNNYYYICIKDHVSALTFPSNDPENWTLINSILPPIAWNETTQYEDGTFIIYKQMSYFQAQNNPPIGTSPDDDSGSMYWKEFCSIYGAPGWEDSNSYDIGDIVVYKGIEYICEAATSSSPAIDSSWSVYRRTEEEGGGSENEEPYLTSIAAGSYNIYCASVYASSACPAGYSFTENINGTMSSSSVSGAFTLMTIYGERGIDEQPFPSCSFYNQGTYVGSINETETGYVSIDSTTTVSSWFYNAFNALVQ